MSDKSQDSIEYDEQSSRSTSVGRTICSETTNPFIFGSHVSRKNRYGPVKKDSPRSFSNCMDFIIKHRKQGKNHFDWIKTLLGNLMLNSRPDQFDVLVNGFADHYQLTIYRFNCDNRGLVDTSQCIRYTGSSMQRKGMENYPDMTFILSEPGNCYFKSLFITNDRNIPQTCFRSDDQNIRNHLCQLLEEENENIRLADARRAWNLPFSNEPEKNMEYESATGGGPSIHISDEYYHEELVKSMNENVEKLSELQHREEHLDMDFDLSSTIELGDRRIATIESSELQALIAPNDLENNPINKENSIHSEITLIDKLNAYDAPKIIKEPTRHRHARMLSDVANKKCPLVQAGETHDQRKYIEVEVPSFEQRAADDLYLCVHVVTENGFDHPWKCVLPPEATAVMSLMVNGNERPCLQYNPLDFDLEQQRAFIKINAAERRKCRKTVKIRLFNWKQCSSPIKDAIEKENLRLCRIEFHLCLRPSSKEYHLLSLRSLTEIIEDGDGVIDIDLSKVKPKQLCECGGERISFPLNVNCTKRCLDIQCQESKMDGKHYSISKKNVLVISPPKKPNSNQLHVVISKKNPIKNDFNEQLNILYDVVLPYVRHEILHEHDCSRSRCLPVHYQQ